jgi:quercetin dioxygenase-like cupin family protein
MHIPIGVALLAAIAVAGPATAQVVRTTILKTSTTWDGAPITYSAATKPEVQTVVVEIAVGGKTTWHKHTVNNVVYVLSGSVRIELENGGSHEFKAGESFAEVANTWHRGVNVGDAPLRMLAVYTGEVGTPISVPKP